MKIILPWFPPELSPNHSNNKNFHKKAKIKKQFKKECYYLTINQNPEKLPEENIHIKITFIPSTWRKRDLDNCIAAMKSGLDGMADALNVDDKYFRPMTLDFGKSDKKNPRVEIEFIKN